MGHIITKTQFYHNGEYRKASEVKIDLYSQTLHYGYGDSKESVL